MSTAQDAPGTNLTDRLRERIRREGPVSFHDWMETALYDERDGYYCRPDFVRQGRSGDYRTAPETSALFAATFANYFAKSYFDFGVPRRWTIVEAGAGSGDFARGVLTSLQTCFPKVFEATRYLIDEVSSATRAKAHARLEQFSDRVEFRRFCEISEPFAEAIIFSNELIDAFPVHRVISRGDGLRELCVGIDETENFVWVECELDSRVAEYCKGIGLRLAQGQIYEINLEAREFVSRASSLLKRGLLITVDYGASRHELINRYEGTLRAFRKHQFVDDVLANPGVQDLTTTVDWTQLQEAGALYGLQQLRFERLDQFLLNEGLLETLPTMASQLGKPADVVNLQLGAREMIRPDGLAASFQVLIQRKEG